MKSNVLIGLGLGAFLFSPSTSHAQKAKEAKTPNVIFIYADDLGYGDLECYGATRVQTPNVNKLADSGIRFTNTHATQPPVPHPVIPCLPENMPGADRYGPSLPVMPE